MSIDMTLQKWAIIIMGGCMGKFLIFCRIQLKFRFWLYKKCWHIYHESFISKKQVINKLSPKILWQTYMKWTILTDGCRLQARQYWISQETVSGPCAWDLAVKPLSCSGGTAVRTGSRSDGNLPDVWSGAKTCLIIFSKGSLIYLILYITYLDYYI